MAKAEVYRRFSQECLELARTADSERTRRALVHMAQVWLQLAEVHAADEEPAEHD